MTTKIIKIILLIASGLLVLTSFVLFIICEIHPDLKLMEGSIGTFMTSIIALGSAIGIDIKAITNLIKKVN